MQPQSPNPDFDFMLKDQPAAKRGMTSLGLPKPVKIILIAVVGITVLAVILSVLSGHKSAKSQPMLNVLSRGQETLRVTSLVQRQLQLQDPQTQALAATVATTLSSDQQQLLNYLNGIHTKVSKAQLAASTDKSTDASLQTAAQNNSLDTVYVAYLKTALAKYQNDLNTAYKSAGPKGQNLLQAEYQSAKTLLSTAPLNT